ncbi:MAG: hypothetical protein WDW36_006607 [Sanguina aurantia]
MQATSTPDGGDHVQAQKSGPRAAVFLSPRWVPGEDDVSPTGPAVLQSANRLFLRIRASLTRCARMISRGATLQALSAVFQRVLGLYAHELLRRLPKNAHGQTSGVASWSSSEWQVRVDEDEEKVLCYILHTAEFCRETVEGLSAAVKKDIKPVLADGVGVVEQGPTVFTPSPQLAHRVRVCLASACRRAPAPPPWHPHCTFASAGVQRCAHSCVCVCLPREEPPVGDSQARVACHRHGRTRLCLLPTTARRSVLHHLDVIPESLQRPRTSKHPTLPLPPLHACRHTPAVQIDYGEEESVFLTVASQAMGVLVLGVSSRLDASLQEMVRLRWDTLENPGDDSPYVNTTRKVLLECAPRIGEGLDRVNFSFFCDKLARSFVPRLHEGVLRLKRISEKGTIQLSIDVDALKRILADFPKGSPCQPPPMVRVRAPSDARAGQPGGQRAASEQPAVNATSGCVGANDDVTCDTSPSREVGQCTCGQAVACPMSLDTHDLASYFTYLEREMSSLMHLVKVLQSKPEYLVDTYLLLMPATAQTLPEFQRVCDIKALTRKQQSDLMALFQSKLSGGPSGGGPHHPDGASPHSSSSSAAAAAAAAPTPISTAASNLGAFKLNMSAFTRDVASSLTMPGRGRRLLLLPAAAAAGRTAPPAASAATAAASATGASFQGRNLSNTDGFSVAATKAKEGFSKLGGLISKIGSDTLGGDSAQ